MKLLPTTLLASVALACSGTSIAADLQVKVGGVPSSSGKVTVSVYRSADVFLKTPAQVASAPAVAGTTLVVLKGLEGGDYAVSAYHDENGNDRIDRGSMGIPTESYGFGNDASGAMGPPAFDQARIAVPHTGASTTLTVRSAQGGANR